MWDGQKFEMKWNEMEGNSKNTYFLELGPSVFALVTSQVFAAAASFTLKKAHVMHKYMWLLLCLKRKKILFGLRIEDSHALKYKLLGGDRNGFSSNWPPCILTLKPITESGTWSASWGLGGQLGLGARGGDWLIAHFCSGSPSSIITRPVPSHLGPLLWQCSGSCWHELHGSYLSILRGFMAGGSQNTLHLDSFWDVAASRSWWCWPSPSVVLLA